MEGIDIPKLKLERVGESSAEGSPNGSGRGSGPRLSSSNARSIYERRSSINDSPSFRLNRTLGDIVDQRSVRGENGNVLTNVSFCVGEDNQYRLGAHDGLVQPPVVLRGGRWALFHTLAQAPTEGMTPRTAECALDEALWGLIGVCLDSSDLWREYRLREGIRRQSGEEGATGQFYGIIRESEWVEYLMQAGDRDWRRPGEIAAALRGSTPRTSRGSALFCAPTARPVYTHLWTTERLGDVQSINALSPVVAFTIINDNWYRT